MQTKKKSLLEAIVGTTLGFIVSMILSYMVLPFFGVEKSISTSIQITMIYTVASVIRSYVVRRVFNMVAAR